MRSRPSVSLYVFIALSTLAWLSKKKQSEADGICAAANAAVDVWRQEPEPLQVLSKRNSIEINGFTPKSKLE